MKNNLTSLDARRSHDIGDVMDRIWAKSFGPALAGPDGDPSPSVSALRAASLSQGSTREAGSANNAPASDQ